MLEDSPRMVKRALIRTMWTENERAPEIDVIDVGIGEYIAVINDQQIVISRPATHDKVRAAIRIFLKDEPNHVF